MSNKERVEMLLKLSNIRERLPNGWRKEMIRRRPEWDNHEWYNRISNTHRMVIFNKDIISEMESIANESAVEQNIVYSSRGQVEKSRA